MGPWDQLGPRHPSEGLKPPARPPRALRGKKPLPTIPSQLLPTSETPPPPPPGSSDSSSQAAPRPVRVPSLSPPPDLSLRPQAWCAIRVRK